MKISMHADTHTHTHTHTHTYRHLHQNNFKKPGACRPHGASRRATGLISIRKNHLTICLIMIAMCACIFCLLAS